MFIVANLASIPILAVYMFDLVALPYLDNVTKMLFVMGFLIAGMIYIGMNPVINVLMKYPKHNEI
jgi:hypothetical protein